MEEGNRWQRGGKKGKDGNMEGKTGINERGIGSSKGNGHVGGRKETSEEVTIKYKEDEEN